MRKYLSCGKFNKYSYYIFLSIFFDLINDALYGFNYLDIFQDVKILDTKAQKYFSWHHIIHQTFNYFGVIIFAIIIIIYEKNASKKPYKISNSKTDSNTKQILLIHNDSENLHSEKKYFIISLIIIFFWIIEELLIDIYIYALKDLDFWMVELLIITKINSIMFNIDIYEHQKFALWFNIFPCLLKIITIVLSFFDDNNKNNNKDIKENQKEHIPILYNIDKIYIPIGIVIYIVLITIRSYVNAKIKWFMDLKYISHSKLLLYYGIIGTIICAIISTVSTFIECKDILGIFDINDYICKIPYHENSTYIEESKYFESVIYYYRTFKGEISDEFKQIEIFYEIIIIIGGMITFFFEKYFSILVIKYLTPVHLIFSIPLFYFIQKAVLILYNLAIDQLYIHSAIKYILIKFFLDIFGDFFSIFGFLIYLEMIELNFGKYNYNTKQNIISRSFGESYGINKKKKKPIINDSEEGEDEDEEEEEEDDESDYDLSIK